MKTKIRISYISPIALSIEFFLIVAVSIRNTRLEEWMYFFGFAIILYLAISVFFNNMYIYSLWHGFVEKIMKNNKLEKVKLYMINSVTYIPLWIVSYINLDRDFFNRALYVILVYQMISFLLLLKDVTEYEIYSVFAVVLVVLFLVLFLF